MALGEVPQLAILRTLEGIQTDGLTKQPQNSSVEYAFKHGLNNIETFKKTRKN